MPFFLAKTDPDDYSLDDLERDHHTTWNGVKNPQALKAIRAMQPGDLVFLYASGTARSVVGLAKVASTPRPDPKDPKLTVVDFEFFARFKTGAKLSEIKGSNLFNDWALVRQGRLSTMEAPPEFVQWMRAKEPSVKF
jgi:predicted RNA-binding protein with PUA-like domain